MKRDQAAGSRPAGQVRDTRRGSDGKKSGRSTALPTAKQGAPIELRRQEVEIRIDGPGIVLDMRIVDKSGPRHVVTVRPSKGGHWARLREIAEGKVQHGAVKLVYSPSARRKDGKRGKWYALISYSMPMPVKAPAESGGALVAHRGHRNFLTLMSSAPGLVKYVGGYGMRNRWRQLEARSRDAKDGLDEIGSGARGHGRARSIPNARAHRRQNPSLVSTRSASKRP